MNRKLTVLFFLLILPAFVLAGTVGKIKGKVTDLQSGEPLIGANVLVVGTSFGAATNVNGEYTIQNLDAGAYEVRSSFIGYQTITISNVRVNADLTTELNFELPAEGITIDEINVVAERPLINKSSTNAQRITTSDDIDALPVRGINNILAITPGVTLQDNTIFIRGGRQDEVGYYLEGASITDPFVGGRSVTLVQDALEEIQVQSGGYTAEFGNANAGIIRQQFKSGTSDLKFSLEYITDNITAKGKGDRFDGKERLGAHWFGSTDFIATLSGPIIDKKFKFFGLFNYNYQNDQNPQPYPGMDLGLIGDPSTGDTLNFFYPAGALYKNSLENYTGTATITLDFNPLIFRLVGTYTANTSFNPFSSSRVAGNIANFLNLDRVEQRDGKDGSFSLKATHILSPTTYYEISGGYSFNKASIFDPFLKDNYTAYGDSAANAAVGFVWERRPAQGGPQPYTREPAFNIFTFSFNAPGDVTAGYAKRNRENINLNGSLSTDIGSAHSLKVGGEFQLFRIRNYSLGNESAFALAGLLANPGTQSRDDIFINRGVNNYGYDIFGNEDDSGGGDKFNALKKPIFVAGYVQDKISYKDLIINLGLRFDYFNVDNFQFIDPSRPELSFDKSTGRVKQDGLVEVPSFSAVSPRLGFSFPVTDLTVFHAQFGKFVQQTRLRDIYQGLYATSSNIGGGFFITAPVGFNVRPTRTTQYEIGFTQQIANFASFDITGYYKDILDQVVYQQQKTAQGSPYGAYAILTNGDFATTKGLEISFNMRRQSRFQVNGSISFQDAQGTGSFPNSNRGIVGAPLDGVTIFNPQYVSPLEFNNAVRGNFNLDYRFGKDDGPAVLNEFGVSAILTFNSGHPFTQGIGGADLEGDARDRQPIEPLNSSTTPWNYQVDLRIDKSFSIFDKLGANIYLFVINVLDTKNIQNVFLRTGSATDDGYLSDPTSGGQLVSTLGPDYARLYKAVNIDYSEQWQAATTGAAYTTTPYFYGPPRQIRLGVRLEY
ncbi:MAG: TonB-dependent receptor [Ignavibacteriaceae bacterium]